MKNKSWELTPEAMQKINQYFDTRSEGMDANELRIFMERLKRRLEDETLTPEERKKLENELKDTQELYNKAGYEKGDSNAYGKTENEGR